MNRQQRRKAQRDAQHRNAFWDRYETDIIDRQNKVDERTIEVICTAVALALYETHGWTGKGINRVITKTDQIMQRISKGESYSDLKNELETKTNVYLKFMD